MQNMQIFRKAIVIALLCVILCVAGCGMTPANGSKTEQLPAASATIESSGTPDTPTAPQRQTLTFLFFSDTQPNPEIGEFSGVGELTRNAVLRAENAELILFGGDTVNDGGDESEWLGFSRAIGSSLEGLTIAAAAGNHDNHALLAGKFDLPDQAPARPGEGYFYTLCIGSVYFVVLDSNTMGAGNQRDVEWLQSALRSEAARQADWRVAVMHHPMWSVSDHPRDLQRAETMREYFLPVLEENDVALILCGHQHVYTRTVPMRGDAASGSGSGIVQVMAASGAKAPYPVGERDFIAVNDIAPNYLILTADGDSLSITALDGEHKVIDEFIIHNS